MLVYESHNAVWYRNVVVPSPSLGLYVTQCCFDILRYCTHIWRWFMSLTGFDIVMTSYSQLVLVLYVTHVCFDIIMTSDTWFVSIYVSHIYYYYDNNDFVLTIGLGLYVTQYGFNIVMISYSRLASVAMLQNFVWFRNGIVFKVRLSIWYFMSQIYFRYIVNLVVVMNGLGLYATQCPFDTVMASYTVYTQLALVY